MDVMASNACLVSDYHEDFNLYFPKVPIPLYDSPAEAKEVCSKLLKEENLRKDIVAQCHEIIEEKYRFKRYRKNWEDILGISLCSKEKGTIEFLFPQEFIKDTHKAKESKSVNRGYTQRLQYKIWKHLGKKLRKKGIIQ